MLWARLPPTMRQQVKGSVCICQQSWQNALTPTSWRSRPACHVVRVIRACGKRGGYNTTSLRVGRFAQLIGRACGIDPNFAGAGPSAALCVRVRAAVHRTSALNTPSDNPDAGLPACKYGLSAPSQKGELRCLHNHHGETLKGSPEM